MWERASAAGRVGGRPSALAAFEPAAARPTNLTVYHAGGGRARRAAAYDVWALHTEARGVSLDDARNALVSRGRR